MEAIEQKRGQLANLCRQYRVQRLALFGSALRDDFNSAHSDLDFLVEFEPLTAGTYADTYFGLMKPWSNSSSDRGISLSNRLSKTPTSARALNVARPCSMQLEGISI
jgi:hypothetical protein